MASSDDKTNDVVKDFSRPRLFSGVNRQLKTVGVRSVTLSELSDRYFGNTGSFRFAGPLEGFVSTQQVDLDYTRFENHTFFNSAVAKVNVAFDRLINHFPFDGARKEIEEFVENLTGFENHVYQRFPKYTGYLNFSGSGPLGLYSENNDNAAGVDDGKGSYIKILDSAGSLFPDFSTNNTGQTVLDPEGSSFTIDLQVYPSPIPNSNQVICQMKPNEGVSDRAFTLALSASTTTTGSNLIFSVVSGATRFTAKTTCAKGAWQRIVASYDRSSGQNNLKLYVDEQLKKTSLSNEIDDFYFNVGTMTIGSGSKVATGSLNAEEAEAEFFTPHETFSGSIDEFRFYHGLRSIPKQEADKTKTIYPNNIEGLVAYYKFNEPTGSHNMEEIVLDSSGNSLHGKITNYSQDLRLTSSFYGAELLKPILYEARDVSPILFPNYYSVKSLNEELLNSGSAYDEENPNLITRLIPGHYLAEGRSEQGLKSQDIGLLEENTYDGASIPGSGKITSAQIITAFLLTWAKFFDELKIFIDDFSNIVHPDYDANISVSDKFLLFASRYYGLTLPAIFADSSIIQFVDGDNLTIDLSKSAGSLEHVQNQIWRRMLTNLREIIRSKGTIHGIESLIRTMGVEPRNNFRIREFGGPSHKRLTNHREERSEIASMLDFSGSLADFDHAATDGANDAQGFLETHLGYMPRLISSPLSSSRVEAGWPFLGTDITGSASKFVNPRGPLVRGVPGLSPNQFNITGSYVIRDKKHGWGYNDGYIGPGISNGANDGLLTSASWTYEAIYKFPLRAVSGAYDLTQSLVRMVVTGSTQAPSQSLIFNVVAYSGSSKVSLFGRPGRASELDDAPLLHMPLTGANLFDGNKWNVSFGRFRGDEINVPGSSSWYLRCARPSYDGKVQEIYATQSYFQTAPDHLGVTSASQAGVLQSMGSDNLLGLFIVMGSQSIANYADSHANERFLHKNSFMADTVFKAARHTLFQGSVGQIRFWSRGFEEDEWREHVRNFKSLATNSPLTNFNFATWESGSFERLRLDVSVDQIVTKSDSSGEILLTDFSQNFKDPLRNSQNHTRYFITGSGFEPSKQVIDPERFFFSILSPKFDTRTSSEKIRVRGFLDPKNMSDKPYALPAPVHEIFPGEEPDDDPRFSIDFSCVQALDEDIMSLFTTLEFFENALGDPRLMYGNIYPDLDQLQKIYFNRLVDRIDFKTFFDFFKWFDTTFTVIIEQLIPRKVEFLGVNYVIESHVLERHRLKHQGEAMYLNLEDRDIVASEVSADNLAEITGDEEWEAIDTLIGEIGGY